MASYFGRWQVQDDRSILFVLSSEQSSTLERKYATGSVEVSFFRPVDGSTALVDQVECSRECG